MAERYHQYVAIYIIRQCTRNETRISKDPRTNIREKRICGCITCNDIGNLCVIPLVHVVSEFFSSTTSSRAIIIQQARNMKWALIHDSGGCLLFSLLTVSKRTSTYASVISSKRWVFLCPKIFRYCRYLYYCIHSHRVLLDQLLPVENYPFNSCPRLLYVILPSLFLGSLPYLFRLWQSEKENIRVS